MVSLVALFMKIDERNSMFWNDCDRVKMLVDLYEHFEW